MREILFLLFVIVFSTETYSQNYIKIKFDPNIYGLSVRDIIKDTLKPSQTYKLVKPKKIKNFIEGVKVAEKYLNQELAPHEKEYITKQRPYRIFQIGNYYLLSGEYFRIPGGVNMILDKRDSRLIHLSFHRPD